MKAVLLSLLLLFTIGAVKAETRLTSSQKIVQLESQLRASSATIAELMTEVTLLKSEGFADKSTNHECDERPPREPRVTCVQNCTVRQNDGRCLHYGPDFCAPHAQCRPNCTVRQNDGRCLHYSADRCN